MDRRAKFEALEKHAWFGRHFLKMRKAELGACLTFLEDHQAMSNDEFVLALNRWMMDRLERPKNWGMMVELLQAAASAERSAQNIPK